MFGVEGFEGFGVQDLVALFLQSVPQCKRLEGTSTQQTAC